MVDPLIVGAGISAGANILGGLFGSSAQSKANRANERNAALDREQQLQFARQGVTWRVKDAQNAGVHPLFAMGAALPTYSPTSISNIPETGLSAGISSAGQDIGRAVQATSTAGQRTESAEMRQLVLRNAQLKNDFLAAQIAQMGATQPASIGPNFPSADPGLTGFMPGQGTRVVDQPQLRTTPHPDAMHSEPGAMVDVGWAKTASGGYAPVPSEDVKQRIEDQLIPELAWALRNYGPQKQPPPFKPPPGMKWKFSYTTGYWQPVLQRRPRMLNMRKSLLRHRPMGATRKPRSRRGYKGRTFTKKRRY